MILTFRITYYHVRLYLPHIKLNNIFIDTNTDCPFSGLQTDTWPKLPTIYRFNSRANVFSGPSFMPLHIEFTTLSANVRARTPSIPIHYPLWKQFKIQRVSTMNINPMDGFCNNKRTLSASLDDVIISTNIYTMKWINGLAGKYRWLSISLTNLECFFVGIFSGAWLGCTHSTSWIALVEI